LEDRVNKKETKKPNNQRKTRDLPPITIPLIK
jgi:hypothetical protein